MSSMNSPIGIYIVQDRKFVFSNAKFQEITGYSEAELLGRHPLELVIDEDKSYVRESSIQMLKGEKKDPYNFRILNKDGTIRWIIETAVSIRYQERLAAMGNFMDITETKKTEESLRESETKYRSLFELARDGIVIISYTDGRILDSNLEFQRQTQFDNRHLLQKKIWETQPPEFRDEAKETFFRFRENCGGIVSWRLFQCRDGKVLPVEIAAQRMYIEGTDVILCMVRDISEREAMMRALRLASEEWRKSFDAITDPVLLINPDFKIHRANLSTARMLKTDVRDIIGRRCHELFHGTDVPPDYCPHVKAQQKGIYCEAEKDEPYLGRTLHFASSPMENEIGEVTHTVEIISDVSSKRRYERESARLSQVLAASFEGITGALSDMVESRDPYTAGHSRHVAELSVLIGKQQGLSEEELQGLRICASLHDIGKAIIPAAILNKPGKLSKHEWGLIREHPTTAYEALRLIPFPWPVADVVHQHHERLDGSGYPLGLKGNQIHPWASIIAVADIVDAMTSHRPYRPRLPQRNALDEIEKGYGVLYDPEVADALIYTLGLDNNRVMVIDNDSKSLEEILNGLKADGFFAAGYSDPAVAVSAFIEKPFPVVITALKMPGMDGVQLAGKIKKINPDSEIILITKYKSNTDILRALRAGASDFLEKPVDMDILKQSVNHAIRQFAENVRDF